MTESNVSVTDNGKQQLRTSRRRLKPIAAPYDTPKGKANLPNYAGSGKSSESANLNEDSINSSKFNNVVTLEFETLFKELAGTSSRNSKENSSSRLTRSMSLAHTSNDTHMFSTASNYQKNISRNTLDPDDNISMIALPSSCNRDSIGSPKHGYKNSKLITQGDITCQVTNPIMSSVSVASEAYLSSFDERAESGAAEGSSSELPIQDDDSSDETSEEYETESEEINDLGGHSICCETGSSRTSGPI